MKGFSFVYAHEGEWINHPVEGIMVKQLSGDDEKMYATLLMRVAAGTKYPEHDHTGPKSVMCLPAAFGLANTSYEPAISIMRSREPITVKS